MKDRELYRKLYNKNFKKLGRKNATLSLDVVYLRHKYVTMTKIQLFEPELQENAAVFKALSHPARLAILKYLAETKVCISGDISDELPLSRTTVHQHLAELKKLGLIKGEISGVTTNYCLNTATIKAVNERLNTFLSELKSCTDNQC